MTPEEKAEQLYDKFLRYVPAEEEFEHEYAKQCALIAVDEILWEIVKYADNSREYVVENSLFWQNVKQEIEKM